MPKETNISDLVYEAMMASLEETGVKATSIYLGKEETFVLRKWLYENQCAPAFNQDLTVIPRLKVHGLPCFEVNLPNHFAVCTTNACNP